MFRIKKDGYNSVQLLPDYQSADNLSERQELAPAPLSTEILETRRRRRNRIMLLILLVLVIAAAVAGKLLWDREQSASITAEQYLEAFQKADYDACADMAKKKDQDKAFQKAVKSTVVDAAKDAYQEYVQGGVEEDDALGTLRAIDRASGSWFRGDISGYINNIQGIGAMYSAIWKVSDIMDNGKFEEAYNILTESVKAGERYESNPAWALTPVIQENLAGLKFYLFDRYANEVQNGEEGRQFIRESAQFLTTYVEDADFAGYLSTLQGVEDGDYSVNEAAAAAREVAESARADWNAAHPAPSLAA